MELNGALSNPRAILEVSGLVAQHARLVAKAVLSPRVQRPIPAGIPPVAAIVSGVLADAARPMRACEVHRAAEEAFGAALRWKSVKAALAAGARGEVARFERVSYGVYQLADSLCAASETLPRPSWSAFSSPDLRPSSRFSRVAGQGKSAESGN